MNPRYQRYADRIRELIQEGEHLAGMEQPSTVGSYIQDNTLLRSWLVKVENVIQNIFGTESAHYQQYQLLVKSNPWSEHAHEVQQRIGLLAGALDDLEQGYLIGQEFIVAAEVFDSILEQAQHLNENGYKDPAAVLARVVLEDTLKRLARQEGIADDQSANRINDELRRANRYPQPQWRLVQGWLDIGNAAAHGRFDEYGQPQVERLIEDIERFIATELRGP